MAFTPTKKDNFESKIKNYLMDGYVIRCDGRDDKPIEVMVREVIKNLNTMRNIGLEKNGIVEEIYCSHEIFYKVVKELEQEYSVRKIGCGGSGCCQYYTKGYYLD